MVAIFRFLWLLYRLNVTIIWRECDKMMEMVLRFCDKPLLLDVQFFAGCIITSVHLEEIEAI